MTSRSAYLVIALLTAPAFAQGAEGPSVLVQTQPAKRGELPRTLSAYGSAGAAANGAMTLSVPLEGRVTKIFTPVGQRVRRGQDILEFELSASVSASLTQARTALETAQTEQARIKRMLSEQLATRDQMAQADKAAADAASALQALQTASGGLSNSRLQAPYDGIVSTVSVAQGDRVAANAALVTVTRRGGVVVTVGVEPRDRSYVKVGEPVSLASLSDGEHTLKGTVSRVGESLNAKTRLIDTDIAVDEALIGETYNAKIDAGRVAGWIVAKNAVVETENGPVIFQIESNKAKQVSVQRLWVTEDSVVVSGALADALPVATTGSYQLADGMDVRENNDASNSARVAQ